MTKYLITPTLINSYQYYINDEFKSPADSRADFLKTLSREKFEPNQAMQKGIDFENAICRVSEHLAKWECEPDCIPALEFCNYQIIKELAEKVCYGLWQQSVKKEINVGNQEFLLYGRTDVIKRDTIYDIKFTSNYELGKFLDSSQHLIYLYCSGLPNFSYLVSDGKDWWREDYHNHEKVEDQIKSKIADFMSYLENDLEAKEVFLTKWGAKND
jgi:hypothetical protein